MYSEQSTWQARLDRLIDAVADDIHDAAAAIDRIDVRYVLMDLARAWPTEPMRDQVAALEALCRKIGVAQTVQQAYDPGWQRLQDVGPLAGRWWPMLVGVMLAYASVPEMTDRVRPGVAAKCLNAACQAIECASQRPDVGDVAELAAWADELLGAWEREAVS